MKHPSRVQSAVPCRCARRRGCIVCTSTSHLLRTRSAASLRNRSCLDPHVIAEEAGLTYVSDLMPGIRRMRKGRGFLYIHHDGARITDQRVIARIRSLVIPPAWTDIWICAQAEGHVQVTGRDARGRKQYRYHPAWREMRDRMKYDRLQLFGLILPCIREHVAIDLKRRGLPRPKMIAVIVRLLDATHQRVGNEEYVRENGSYGLTTLLDRHLQVQPRGEIHLRFRGKSGQAQDIRFHDTELARILRRCRRMPGKELFRYRDSRGRLRSISAEDVNAYLGRLTEEMFTAKDFRTWAGTVLAALALRHLGQAETKTEERRKIVSAVKEVARQLGNKPAACRKYYIDPRVFDAYVAGRLPRMPGSSSNVSSAIALKPEERAVLRLLRRF